jgi:hypothetical protein
MRVKKKDKKAKEASDKTVVASVTDEITQSCEPKSAQVEADEQSNKRHGKPKKHRAGGAAKTHIEQYGTGTPQLKKGPERYQKIAGRCPMTMDPSDVSL